jgi:hypothetical protein
MSKVNVPLVIGVVLIPIIAIGISIQGGLSTGMRGGTWEQPGECDSKGAFIKCEGRVERIERNALGTYTIMVRTKTGLRTVLSNERTMSVGETYNFIAQRDNGMLVKSRGWSRVVVPLTICTDETDNSMNQIGSKSGYFEFDEGMYALVNELGPKRISISQQGVYRVVGVELVDSCN